MALSHPPRTASLYLGAALLMGCIGAQATVIYQYSASWPPLKSVQPNQCHTTVVPIPAGQGVITMRLKMSPFYKRNFHNRSEDVVVHSIRDFSRSYWATYNGGPASSANTQEGIMLDRIERWEVGSSGQLSTPISLCNPHHCSGNNCSQPAANASLVVDFAPGASREHLTPPPEVATPKAPAAAPPAAVPPATATPPAVAKPTPPPLVAPQPGAKASPGPGVPPSNRPVVNHAQAGARASQSSVYTGGCPAGPQYAIDGVSAAGVANGCATPIAHTNSESRPWWRVSFPGARVINRIVVWNRNDVAKERLTNFEVSVRDAQDQVLFRTVAFATGGYPNPSLEIAVPSVTGHHVQVQLLGTNYLTLAEVQVFGPAP